MHISTNNDKIDLYFEKSNCTMRLPPLGTHKQVPERHLQLFGNFPQCANFWISQATLQAPHDIRVHTCLEGQILLA
jgi:hypothetical protein